MVHLARLAAKPHVSSDTPSHNKKRFHIDVTWCGRPEMSSARLTCALLTSPTACFRLHCLRITVSLATLISHHTMSWEQTGIEATRARPDSPGNQGQGASHD